MSASALVHDDALLLVHFSDLHVRGRSCVAFERIVTAGSAIGSLVDGQAHIAVVISGDLAYSGLAEQYEQVGEALSKLKAELEKWKPKSIRVIVSPGNHDCDFGAVPAAVRGALLSSSGIDCEIFDALKATQAAFFDFADAISGGASTQVAKAIEQHQFMVGGHRVSCLCVNTAWSSRIKETPGTLLMPEILIDGAIEPADYSIAIAHHPLNWFSPESAVILSEWMDAHADVVLLGHEHRIDHFNQSRKRTGSSVSYEIAHPIDDDQVACGFKCQKINFTEATVQDYDFYYRSSGAVETVHISDRSLVLNPAKDNTATRLTPEFEAFLSDPGAAFAHPRLARAISLNDILVSPELRCIQSNGKEQERIDNGLSCDEVVSKIKSCLGRHVIFGGEQAGKSTFAKLLATSLRSDRFVPLYLDCAMLASLNAGEIKSWYRACIRRQYREAEPIEQTEPMSVVAILDNTHQTKGGLNGLEKVLSFIEGKAATQVLLTSDHPATSIVIAAENHERSFWAEATAFEILPLSHRRRADLIRRWVSLGRDVIEDAAQIECEVRQAKAFLDRAMGRNALPKHPVFVLIVLQQLLEGARFSQAKIEKGSHAFLFEALITRELDRWARSHEMATVHSFLGRLALELWNRDESSLSGGALRHIVAGMRSEFSDVDLELLLDDLTAAKVLTRDGDLVRFKYQYLYFYFVAKRVVTLPELNASVVVDQLIKFVHTEQSSNILMYLAHLGAYKNVAARLVELLDDLFSGYTAGELEIHSKLALKFRTQEQREVLFQGPASEITDHHHELQDEVESSNGEHASEQVQDAFKFNTLLRAVHIVGQILRGRGADLSPELKRSLAVSCIGATRRMLAFAYEAIDANSDAIVRMASDAFEKAMRVERNRAVDIANTVLGFVVVTLAKAFVGKAAEALGSSELRSLLEQLWIEQPDPDFKLILACARVSGDRTYPKELVEDLHGSIRKSNVLSAAALAHVVARRFYLSPPERGTRDSACTLLGISVVSIRNKVLK